jgi:hypothetical protein
LDFGFRVPGFGFRVSGFRFRVPGFGFQVWQYPMDMAEKGTEDTNSMTSVGAVNPGSERVTFAPGRRSDSCRGVGDWGFGVLGCRVWGVGYRV